MKPEIRCFAVATTLLFSAGCLSATNGQGFDGTWGSRVVTNGGRTKHVTTLVIKNGKTADMTRDATSTLFRKGESWNNYPEKYKFVSPVHFKITQHSTHLAVNGSQLTIIWDSTQLAEWSPKTIPFRDAVSLADVRQNQSSTLTLNGDDLANNHGQTLHRVK